MDNKAKDTEKAARVAEPSQSGSSWEIKICDANLKSYAKTVKDPMLTGHQILKVAGAKQPLENFTVVRVLESGEIEDFPLDKEMDMRTSENTKCFIFFKKDSSSCQMILDNNEIEWDKPVISGRMLKILAGVDVNEKGVWDKSNDENEVKDSELVCLNPKEGRRFYTGPKQGTEG